MFVRTLEEALADVARRSFYEDVTITPCAATGTSWPIVGYLVEDESGAHMADDWEWTYVDGIIDRDSVDEMSRLHESYETYSNADHVRYNMPLVVAALELGAYVVTLAYVIVRVAGMMWDELPGDYLDADGDPGDDIAGWALAANWSPISL